MSHSNQEVKSKKVRKVFQKAMSLALVTVLTISMMIPVWADNQVPDISQWAVGDLNEGEKYGIYPLDWYYDQFRGQISEDRLDALMVKVDEKIDFIADKVDFKAIPETGKLDRNDVMIRLYNILGSYNLVGKGEVASYMQSEGILNGTATGLQLDKPCNSEQAVILAIRTIQHAYDTLQAGGKGVFWKVENNGNTVYLLGSIHIGNSSVYPLYDLVTDAFNQSEALYVEANILDTGDGMNYFMAKGQYDDGTTLQEHVTKEQYAKIVEVCTLFQIDPAQIATFKPWFLANQFNALAMMMNGDNTASSNQVNLGIDVYFTLNAMLAQKPIVELEGIPFQADMFDGLSKETQSEYLDGILESILNPAVEDENASAKLVAEWLEYWRQGDLESFQKSFHGASEETEDEMSLMLFGQRDINMTEKISAMLESEGNHTYFVVVGAGHYINKGSVIDLLTEKGYAIKWMY